MKKQTKSQKTKKSVVVAPEKRGHNRRQRFLAFIALAGLFTCGLFVGIAMQSPSNVNIHKTSVAEPVVENVESEKVNVAPNDDVCVQVERLLLRRMPAESDNVDDRIDRAKIYVSLAERGCIDNSDAYAELARQELEIARAIDDDNFDHDETIDVVETYKRLHMQEAAEEIFEKAKKLTDPAIEFIIQVEKIINE